MKNIILLSVFVFSMIAMTSVGYASPVDTKTEITFEKASVSLDMVAVLIVKNSLCGFEYSPVSLMRELNVSIYTINPYEFNCQKYSSDTKSVSIMNKGDPEN